MVWENCGQGRGEILPENAKNPQECGQGCVMCVCLPERRNVENSVCWVRVKQGGGRGEITGDAVLGMAGWTAESGDLGTEIGGRNKCYWTGLHTAEFLIKRNKGHMPHYQTSMCLSKERAANRNEKFVIAIWGVETLLEERGIHSLQHCERK